MMDCELCEADPRGLCFKHKIRTLTFNKGQLRNGLHPDLTIRESAKKVVEDGKAAGLDPVPQADKYRWV